TCPITPCARLQRKRSGPMKRYLAVFLSCAAALVVVAVILLPGPAFARTNQIQSFASGASGASISTLHSPLDRGYPSPPVNLGFGCTWTFGTCRAGVYKIHNGRDVAAAVGENVYAVDAGTVKAVVLDGSWRYCITIQHAGFTSVIWHVEPLVNVGNVVTRGQ